ncbi:MAG: flagellar hook-length control protein FliK [Candidatus Gastranaerophilaceae bacterium]
MTQQLDLAFNTKNVLDNMMSQSQLSTSKDKSSYDLNNFGSFLDSANKTYTKENKSFGNTGNNKNSNKNVSANNNTNTGNVKNSTASNNSSSNVNKNIDEKKSSVSYDSKENYKNTKTEDKNVNINNNENEINSVKTVDNTSDNKVNLIENDVKIQDLNIPQIELEANTLEMDIPLTSSLLTETSDIVDINTLANSISDIDKNMSTLQTEDILDVELPADAIKSGIDLKSVSALFGKVQATEVKDNPVDMKIVEDAIKDTVVDKEEVISSMYKSDLKVDKGVENKSDIKDVVLNDNNAQVKKEDSLELEDLKIDDVKLDKTNLDNSNLVQTEKATDDKGLVQNAVDVNLNKTEDKLSDKKVELNDVEVDKKVEINDEKVSTKDLKKDSNADDIRLENKKDIKDDSNDNVLVKDESISVKSVQDVKTNVENIVFVKQDSDVKTDEKIVYSSDKLQKTKDDVQELNNQIKMAKEENSFETLDSANKSRVQDNKKSDEFAKTNVKSDETMQVKDDVKGIEFMSSKTDKKVTDTKEKIVEEKIENVKIQVEENVKVVTNPVNNNEEKVAKANETMNKAGLTTKTLKAMEGKITEVDTPKQETGANFSGETSQEMLMRNILQESVDSAVGEQTVEKVDFKQTINQATQTQTAQRTPQTNDLQDVDIIDQIRAKFAVNSAKGMQRMVIGLTPESLGKLTIEIAKGENGLSAQIFAESAQAKELLDKNLDGLKSTLQAQGVSVNNLNVKVAEAGRSSDSNNNMFRNNEDNQFDSNNKGGNSRDSQDTNKEKRSEYEFMQSNVGATEEIEDDSALTQSPQMEKTVNIGNVKYKV